MEMFLPQIPVASVDEALSVYLLRLSVAVDVKGTNTSRARDHRRVPESSRWVAVHVANTAALLSVW